eukprot:GHRR01015313.1.p1 GENE.GHRR01015313.1~~GHRR01015313.1.p1  ORF type:complete len:503 (+),score=115.18 GHRR01015313.1:615-2123(+)
MRYSRSSTKVRFLIPRNPSCAFKRFLAHNNPHTSSRCAILSYDQGQGVGRATARYRRCLQDCRPATILLAITDELQSSTAAAWFAAHIAGLAALGRLKWQHQLLYSIPVHCFSNMQAGSVIRGHAPAVPNRRLRWQFLPGTAAAARQYNPGCRTVGGWRKYAAAPALDINEIYTAQDKALQPYIGPVNAIRLKTSFGLEATKTLQPGETLLISTPLAVVAHTYGDIASATNKGSADDNADELAYQPTDIDIDKLAQQLMDAEEARTKGWLRYMDDGSLQPARITHLPDLAALMQSSSSSEAEPAASSSSSQPAEETLLDIADLNARVLVEDPELASIGSGQHDDPKTLVGIWPELALMPHSCCPNTTVLVHKSAAIVHSSRSIPKQAAVYQNLLGPQLLAPLMERRQLLQQIRGIKCICPRCRDEERQDPNLLQLIADIYESCTQQIEPELGAAVDADDDVALERLKDQLAAYCEVVDAGFSKLAIKQQSQVWLQVFDLNRH